MIFESKRLAIIFNPKGGSAKAGLIGQLQSALQAKGLELIQYTTTAAPNSARDLARQANSEGVDLVIACGGDWTVCQTAEGLMGTKTPMAILPGGTGNLFSKALYARPDVAKFVELITLGQPQALDMMRLNYRGLDGSDHEQFYLVAVGLGKVSDAISGTSAAMKRRFGKLAYGVKMLAAFFSPQPVTYTVQAKDTGATLKARASVLFALNALPPSMASLSRACNASDGLVDVVALKATGFFSLVILSLRCLVGRPDVSPHYVRLRAKSVRIETDRPVCPNIDGDPGLMTQSMEITTLPQTVRVIAS